MGAAGGMAAANVGLAYAANEQNKPISELNSSIANANANVIEAQAGRIEEIGREDATAVRNKGNLFAGSQQAQMAASGIDLGVGSAVDIVNETLSITIDDAAKVTNNAFLEAMGLRQEASNMRFKDKARKLSEDNAYKTSLVTSGLQGYAMGKGMKNA